MSAYALGTADAPGTMPAAPPLAPNNDGGMKTYQIVIVDGTEFPSMDGPLKKSADPFIILAGTKECFYRQTSTQFRVRARTGVATWNELFKIRVPSDVVFMELEVRDHDLHFSFRNGAERRKEKENMFQFDYLVKVEMGAVPGLDLPKHLEKRLNQSELIGKGELVLQEGFQNVTVFNKGRRVGRIGVNVKELGESAGHNDPGERVLAAQQRRAGADSTPAHTGPPGWAWLLLGGLAMFQPGSHGFISTVAYCCIGGGLFLAAQALLRRIDSNGDGRIDFQEFRRIIPQLIGATSNLSEEGLRNLFDSIDADNSGTLEADEVAAFIKRTFHSNAGDVFALTQSEVMAQISFIMAEGKLWIKETRKNASDLGTVAGKVSLGVSLILYLGSVIWIFWLQMLY